MKYLKLISIETVKFDDASFILSENDQHVHNIYRIFLAYHMKMGACYKIIDGN